MSADPLYATMVDAACNVSSSLLARIVQQQLKAHSRAAIPKSHLDEIYCLRKQVLRVAYTKGQLFYTSWQLNMDHHRVLQSLWLIKLATYRAELRGKPLPPFELVLNPNDKTANEARNNHQPPTHPEPLFCNAKCDDDTGISFPIMFNAQFGRLTGEMSLQLYHDKYSKLDTDGVKLPWLNKTNKAFFTGTNTRGHRSQLYQSKSPHLHVLHQHVPVADYGLYRYLIYAFGFSGWSQRLRELALMDAVVLVESSKCREYYQGVFDEADYVPLKEDLSDLDDVLERVFTTMSESAAEAMAARWRSKGRQIVSLPCVLEYIEQLLRAYGGYLDFEVEIDDAEWTAYDFGQMSLHYNHKPPSNGACERYLVG